MGRTPRPRQGSRAARVSGHNEEAAGVSECSARQRLHSLHQINTGPPSPAYKPVASVPRVTWGNADTRFEELDALLADDSPFDYLCWQFVADEMYGDGGVDKRKAVLRRRVQRFFASSETLYPVIALMGIVRNKLFPERAQEFYGGRTPGAAATA